MAKYIFATNPMLTAFGLAGGTIIITRDPKPAIVVLVLFVLVGLTLKSSLSKQEKDSKVQRMISRGADYISSSKRDKKVLGYDVDRGMLIIEFGGRGRNELHEWPISRVRHVKWEIPGSNRIKSFGPIGLDAATSLAIHNVKDIYAVAHGAGLTIQLADIDRPIVKINLDADQRRMVKWLEILQQAMDGELQKPDRRDVF
ncbi:hypothetical protein [Methylobacterium sp. D48H]